MCREPLGSEPKPLAPWQPAKLGPDLREFMLIRACLQHIAGAREQLLVVVQIRQSPTPSHYFLASTNYSGSINFNTPLSPPRATFFRSEI